jgi:hypothetical protein
MSMRKRPTGSPSAGRWGAFFMFTRSSWRARRVRVTDFAAVPAAPFPPVAQAPREGSPSLFHVALVVVGWAQVLPGHHTTGRVPSRTCQELHLDARERSWNHSAPHPWEMASCPPTRLLQPVMLAWIVLRPNAATYQVRRSCAGRICTAVSPQGALSAELQRFRLAGFRGPLGTRSAARRVTLTRRAVIPPGWCRGVDQTSVGPAGVEPASPHPRVASALLTWGGVEGDDGADAWLGGLAV